MIDGALTGVVLAALCIALEIWKTHRKAEK